MIGKPCTPCIKSDCTPKWCKDFCENCEVETVTLNLTIILIITAVIIIKVYEKSNKSKNR